MNCGKALSFASPLRQSYSVPQYRTSSRSFASCAPCDASATVSLSGQRVIWSRRRRSAMSASGTCARKGRIASSRVASCEAAAGAAVVSCGIVGFFESIDWVRWSAPVDCAAASADGAKATVRPSVRPSAQAERRVTLVQGRASSAPRHRLVQSRSMVDSSWRTVRGAHPIRWAQHLSNVRRQSGGFVATSPLHDGIGRQIGRPRRGPRRGSGA
jgi:hypothetical protein